MNNSRDPKPYKCSNNLPIGLAGGNKIYFITTKGGVITSMNLEDTHNGVKKDVNASAQTNSEMENTLETTVDLLLIIAMQ